MLNVLSVVGQLFLVILFIVVPCVIGWLWGVHDNKKYNRKIERKDNDKDARR